MKAKLHTPWTVLAILALVAALSLTGADCAISINTGSSSRDDEDDRDPTLVIGVGEGVLVDAPVEGVQYESGSLHGITGPDGGFRYEAGGEVRFHIGDIALGGPVPGKALVTPLDLVPGGRLDSPAVTNIARLLQSLDAIPGDGRITVPARVRERARRDNHALSASLEHLDFTDDTFFVNSAAHLLAVLTHDYPHTAVLVDAAQARRHMREVLRQRGVLH